MLNPIPASKAKQYLEIELKKDGSFAFNRILPKSEIFPDWKDYKISDAILGDQKYFEDAANFTAKITGLDKDSCLLNLASALGNIEGIAIGNEVAIRVEEGFFRVTHAAFRTAMLHPIIDFLRMMPMENLKFYNKKLVAENSDEICDLLALNHNISKFDMSQVKIYGMENIRMLAAGPGRDLIMKKIEGNDVFLTGDFFEKLARAISFNSGLKEIDLSDKNATAIYNTDIFESLRKVATEREDLKIKIPDGEILMRAHITAGTAESLASRDLSSISPK